MKISNNSVVTLNYQLYANFPQQEKKHIETTEASHPFTFLFGVGGLIPGFERTLEGLSLGEKFDFMIEVNEAYGETDPNAIINLPMSDHEGNQMNGKAVSFNNEFVTMDFNHPLAGQRLHFSGEVVDVRAASPDEISHGHVHSGAHGIESIY